MASTQSTTAWASPLGTLYSLGTVGSLSDDQLVERYLSRNDPAASEAAFSALVERHGAMVLSVCQRALKNPHDAHDAFQATFLVLVRTARSIDVASRTLLIEVDVENPTGELLAGSYAEVHLKLPSPASTLKVPVSAVIFKSEGVQVATVDRGGRVQIVPVTLGRDFGSFVEVVSGLNGDEQVIVNPPDSLASGQTVRLAKPDQPG